MYLAFRIFGSKIVTIYVRHSCHISVQLFMCLNNQPDMYLTFFTIVFVMVGRISDGHVMCLDIHSYI